MVYLLAVTVAVTQTRTELHWVKYFHIFAAFYNDIIFEANQISTLLQFADIANTLVPKKLSD